MSLLENGQRAAAVMTRTRSRSGAESGTARGFDAAVAERSVFLSKRIEPNNP